MNQKFSKFYYRLKKIAIFFFIPLCLFGWLFFSLPTASADIPKLTNPLDNLKIEIPGLKKIAENYPVTCENKNGQDVCDIPWLSVYIAAIYQYAVGVVGVLAVIIMMVGGIVWITAGGNTNRVGEAKKWIGGAVSGLVLALTSYLILAQINPNLVSFQPLKIALIKPEERKISIRQTCEWYSYCPDNYEQADSSKCSGEAPTDSLSGEKLNTCCCMKGNTGNPDCPAATQGGCNYLQSTFSCFGGNAAKASAICQKESSGNADAESATDKCSIDGKSVSFGLFQINISAHKIGSLDCPKAFSKKYSFSQKDCRVKDIDLYNNCVKAAQDYKKNIQKACEISGGGVSWDSWGANSICHF